MSELKLCFYGDDFTGSTDALECLVRSGMRAVLFIDPPTRAQLANYPGIQAVGVAGCTRALTPRSMESQLRPAFLTLRTLGAPHIHYKVCSTFDSSPHLGSIGRVMELAREYFPSRFIPIVAGTPSLGRYCVFGNLFAQLGTNNPHEVHRLDQHPVMKCHPSTPMCDAEIIKHLSKQTTLPLSLMNVIDLDQPLLQARRILNNNYTSGYSGIVFDAMHDGHLARIGELIDPFGSPENPLFTVGSSAVESALASRWQTNDEIPLGYFERPSDLIKPPSQTKPMLVGSGSCSSVTTLQIKYALQHGAVDVIINPENLTDTQHINTEINRVEQLASRLISQGKNVILHTNGELDSHRTNGTIATNKTNHLNTEELAKTIGTTIGKIMLSLISQYDLKRVCLCGGDTSGYAARVFKLEAVEMISPLVRGAPLCRAIAPNSPADRLEIVFKGGQVGAPDFFQTFYNFTPYPQSRLEYV